MRRTFLAAGLLAALLLPAAPAMAAPAPQPPLDISKMEYAPIGHFSPDKTLPSPDTACAEQLQPMRQGEVFNPSGKFNAFDNNVFEVLCYPFRGPGDTTDNDPVGNAGAPEHGFCGKPYDGSLRGTWVVTAGMCDNHQLEWTRYYAETMKSILADFSPTVRQYTFDLEDPGETGNTRFGRAINTAIVVPGADNPDETIIVGAHYDKTNDGPASAWDSQEGHAEMIRMAKLMADYWHATGTRPSATVKFIPWDGEESGVFGSAHYAENVIVPGEEFKVRGYWNTDPCAGGYPSYRYGNPTDRLRMGIQFADPGAIPGVSAGDATRITDFNKRSEGLIQQVLEHIDDTVPTASGNVDTFISHAEAGGQGDVGKPGGIAIGTDRPILFSSDWRSFEVLGIPFFNPGPEVTGPNEESNGDPNFGPDQSADALSTFHTPNDNLRTMMRFTGPDPAGANFSESWAKGMEFCSHLLAWGMLQPDQGGAQTRNGNIVAYYEALPNEAKEDQKLTFDASGSYQYADPATLAKVPADQLEYTWDFGDGESGSGVNAQHEYDTAGRYQSKLTVRNRQTGQTGTMEVPITILPNDLVPPVLEKPAATDEDGEFELKFDYKGDREGLKGFSIEESRNAAVPLDERVDTLDRWQASTDLPEGVQGWQASDSETPKYHGNLSTSPPRSFWTGVANGQQRYQQGPSEGTSILTLKEGVQLPRGSSAALTYQSSFVNDTGDKGRVQVAIDIGQPADQLEWVTVDSFASGAEDSDTLSAFEENQGDDSGKVFKQRFSDLSKFSGRKLRVRFIYELGAPDPTIPFARAGWYVDDVKIVSGLFREIGQTTQKSFTVSGKPKGTYGYRVKAVFNDDVKSSGSNLETVEVTRGDPNAGSGSLERCASLAVLNRLRVRPSGRDLRVDLGGPGTATSVELFRTSRGRRTLKFRRLARVRTATETVVLRRRTAPRGVYFLRVTTTTPQGDREVRRIPVNHTRGRWVLRRAFQRQPSCALLSSAALGSPVFDGRRPISLRYSVTQPARVTISVYRGLRSKKPIRRVVRNAAANKVLRVRFRGKRVARRGEYRVVVSAKRGDEVVRTTLNARRL